MAETSTGSLRPNRCTTYDSNFAGRKFGICCNQANFEQAPTVTSTF